MTLKEWFESDEGREVIESLTCGPVSQHDAEQALLRAWNAARLDLLERVESSGGS
jgi:hypothetical protein